MESSVAVCSLQLASTVRVQDRAPQLTPTTTTLHCDSPDSDRKNRKATWKSGPLEIERSLQLQFFIQSPIGELCKQPDYVGSQLIS